MNARAFPEMVVIPRPDPGLIQSADEFLELAGASYGEKVDIDPKTGKVVDGKLYVNNGQKALEFFDRDTRNTILRANEKWPIVKDKAL